MKDVRRWLDSLGLGQYADAFEGNAVEWETLPGLDHDLLKEIGVKAVGHRVAILKAIQSTVPEREAPDEAAPAPSCPEPSNEAERRQLTVMFCDLVGSTQLSARLDPEDLREVLRAYQGACTAAVARYKGFVARYMGDGILAYFGYPKAHEDDAERAALAGLEIVRAIGRLDVGERHCHVGCLSVRIGIATGLVVVGDLIGEGASEESPVVGETPNLAARLQALAEPGAVVVSPRTRQLIGNRLDCVDLGARELRGISDPVRAWQLAGDAPTPTPPDAHKSTGLSPLVGRDEELGILLRRWERAASGTGQAVTLAGEPGIGKSRLVEAVVDRLGTGAHPRLGHHCSAFRRGSALHPVVTQLARTAGIVPADTDTNRLAKLDALLEGVGTPPPGHRALLAHLLSVPVAEDEGLSVLPAQRRRLRTLAALLDWFGRLAGQAPVLCVFEDVHWIDPSSLELLEQMVERVSSWPMLIVVTARPEFEPSWTGQAHSTLLTLSRMPAKEAAALAIGAAGTALPEEMVEAIVARSDGIPLFVEELTRSVLDSVSDAQRDATAALADLSIPYTLRDSLMARLDRLANGREIAQIAAVIGREFSHDLVAEIAGREGGELDATLAELVGSGLISRRVTDAGERYRFKHALVHEVAYESLLLSKRRMLHARIVEFLESGRVPETERTAEVLAHHCTEADLTDRAIAYWQQAGRRAAEDAAHAEAILHLTRARALLDRVNAPQDREALEIEVGIGLVSSMRIIDRYDEAFAILDRIEATASAGGRDAELARIHHLRGSLYYPLGQLDKVLVEHQRSLEHARNARSAESEARALGSIGDAHYARGRVLSAHTYFDRCVVACEAGGFGTVEAAHLPMRGMTWTFQNRLADARSDYESAIEIAGPLGEHRAEMIARTGLGRVLCDQGEVEQAVGHVEQAVELAERLGSRHFVPALMVSLCRMLAEQGHHEHAMRMLEEADAISRETGRKFAGARVFGAIAVLSDDPLRRREALAEGEALLAQGSVGHNYYWFYRDAIDASLASADWAEVDRFATEFERFTAEEPVAWSNFFIARGRALAAHGRGRRDDVTVTSLLEVRDAGLRAGHRPAIVMIERALDAFEGAPPA